MPIVITKFHGHYQNRLTTKRVGYIDVGLSPTIVALGDNARGQKGPSMNKISSST